MFLVSRRIARHKVNLALVNSNGILVYFFLEFKGRFTFSGMVFYFSSILLRIKSALRFLFLIRYLRAPVSHSRSRLEFSELVITISLMTFSSLAVNKLSLRKEFLNLKYPRP